MIMIEQVREAVGTNKYGENPRILYTRPRRPNANVVFDKYILDACDRHGIDAAKIGLDREEIYARLQAR